ncbi:MAG: MbcA/ParS/Xre antitoxin family protein [Pseudomonadota bacterium]
MPTAPHASPADRKRLSDAALRAFFDIAEHWRLSRQEAMTLLGIDATSTYANWKAGRAGALPRDTLERISYLLGIHKSLRVLFARHPESVYAWVRKPNDAPLFGGRSALERMLSGQVSDLFLVRQYLDAQRGGWT